MKFVLLHDITGDPTDWDEVKAMLLAQNHQVIVPDMDYIDSNRSLIKDHVSYVERILPSGFLAGDAIVVGHSLGGTVALAMADRFCHVMLVAGLVDMGSEVRHAAPRELEQELEKMFFNPSKLRKSQRARYEKRWFQVLISRQRRRNLKKINQALDLFETVEYINYYQKKITLICAEQDKISSIKDFKTIVRAYPSIELFAIQQCGHTIPIEKPAELSEIILATENKQNKLNTEWYLKAS